MSHLGGRVVACLEARYATEMADLVARHHGISYPAPCLREVHEPDAYATRQAVDMLCSAEIDTAVFLTGVGVETIAEGAHLIGRADEMLASLARKRIAARGPKAANAVRRLGLQVQLVAPAPFTSDSLLDAMSDWNLRGSRVLVQLYGARAPRFTDRLVRAGARVIEVAPYRWERPVDEDAVCRLIEDVAAGWIDVVAATSAIQVRHLFDIARDRGVEADLRRGLDLPQVLIAAQGVICASAFEDKGVAVDVISPKASMGSLVMEIARRCSAPPGAEPALSPLPGGAVIAVLPARDVDSIDEVRTAIAQLPSDTSLAVLAGRTHKGARLVERAAIERGLPLRTVQPDDGGGHHPADELVRGADAVLILTRSGLGVGRLLQLAERYAKPIRVLRCPASGGAVNVA
jgi:uroporphyrinogen-III synthase